MHSPDEEVEFRFYNTGTVNPENTIYSQSTLRVIRAVLAVNPATRDLEVIIKGGPWNGMDILLQRAEAKLLLPESWLDFRASHSRRQCQLSLQVRIATSKEDSTEPPPVFSCQHLIHSFLDEVLETTGNTMMEDDFFETRDSQVVEALEKFSQMPYLIKLNHTTRAGELEVSWTDNQSKVLSKYLGLNCMFLVDSHTSSSCLPLAGDLIVKYDPKRLSEWEIDVDEQGVVHRGRATCGCLEAIVQRQDCQVIYSQLSEQEEYFPMVARASQGSIHGHPPPATKLTPVSVSAHASAKPTRIPIPATVSDGSGSPTPKPPRASIKQGKASQRPPTPAKSSREDDPSTTNYIDISSGYSSDTETQTSRPSPVSRNNPQCNREVTGLGSSNVCGIHPRVLATVELTNQNDDIQLDRHDNCPQPLANFIQEAIAQIVHVYYTTPEQDTAAGGSSKKRKANSM